MNLIIYKNEAYLLLEYIKNNFKKQYKHLDISLTIVETNDLLEGIYIIIKENTLNLQRSKYVDVKGFLKIEDYRDYIMISINDLFIDMINKYYTTS